ncbi:MAG: aspartate aminotransferase family protein [Clostridia bacterium]|nr:aspartate aminotransferase family protein [Clostridia bacterium]
MKNEFSEELKKYEGVCVSATQFGEPDFWEKTQGFYAVDSHGGKYIDLTSSYGVCGIGYNSPNVCNAIKEQCDKLLHSMIEIYPTEVYMKAVKDIVTIFGRFPECQVILAQSGSEAIETALKLCVSYTKRRGIIAFSGAYHGQSLGALSVTSHNILRQNFYGIINESVIFVPFPNVFRNPYESEQELLKYTIELIEHYLRDENSGGIPIGGIIFEPMQNTSGYIIPPKGFYRALRELADKYKVLLISDEIFTGCGRCGNWLVLDEENTFADITCVGKILGGGQPVAACLASKNIMESMRSPICMALHGGTFMGNPIACVAVSATLQEIKEKNLIKKSYEMGEWFRRNLKENLRGTSFSGDIRGKGMATVIEFVIDEKDKKPDPITANDLVDYLYKHKIISLITGIPHFNSVAIAPPLIVSTDILEFVIETIISFFKRR